MKEIKLFIVLLLVATSFKGFTREVDDFDYDGMSSDHSIFLSQVERDQNGNFHQIKTEAKLYFDDLSKSFGEAINITVNINGVDIGMMASSSSNTLSLLKLKSVNRWITENTINVFMEVDIRFIKNLVSEIKPYQVNLADLKVLDDFVSFTSGKISNTKNINTVIQIFKKRTLAKDELVFEKKINDNEFVVSDFGADRSLVTIDLNQLVAKLERGKKHIVKVTLISNFGKWRPFTAAQAELFKSPDMINTETDFRYSK